MKTKYKYLALVGLFLSGSTLSYGASKILSIDFKTQGGQSLIEITGDGPLDYEKSENAKDNQVILDIKNSTLGPQASRKLDTSSFPSPVQLVSPYQVGKGETTRIVVQLRESAPAQVVQNGNSIVMAVTHSGGTASAQRSKNSAMSTGGSGATAEADIPAGPPPTAIPGGAGPGGASDETPDLGTADSSGGNSDPTPVQYPAPDGNVDSTPAVVQSAPSGSKSPGMGPVEKRLDDFLDSTKTKKFVGSPITLQLRDAEILDVFQMIGDASGFNVIVGDDVKGKVTLSLVDAPWDQALDLILSTRQLGAERNNNVLRISTLATLTSEKQAELAAKKAAEANAPRVTRVFPISFAKLGDLQAVFQKFASGTGETSSTVVQTDDRTNSIIVRDTAENMERIRKLIEILDTQTPQVLIEAKVIEAIEGGSNSIAGALALGRGTDTQLTGSFNGGPLPIQPSDAAGFQTTPRPILSLGTSANESKLGAGQIGFSPSLSFLPGFQRLNAVLSMAESDQKIKVVSSPRTVVLNKESASIVQGTPVKVSTIVQTDNGPQTMQTVVSANLSLNVKPTVTNEGSVLLEVNVTRDNPIEGVGVANRNMTTRVLVDSGSTLVIGGIYTSQVNDTSDGFPVLRDIPILGFLFGNRSHSENRNELFIFISPRILNEKESGLTI